MYSYEERKRAVELYIKYDHRAAQVIHELGYPNRHTLKVWYQEFKENGDLHQKRGSTSKYSDEQKRIALEYYAEHGRSISTTIQKLGYPSRTQMLEWVRNEFPGERPPCLTSTPLVHLTQREKESAVIDLCTRTVSAQAIAQKHSISRYSLYNWAWQLKEKGYIATVSKKTPPSNSHNEHELREEITLLKKQAEILKQEVYRLQLERDVLEKAAEIIKKDQGVSLEKLTNREKAIVIDALRDKYKLKELLHVFKMAKSSYCYQKTAINSPDKYSMLREEIHRAFDGSNGTYGYRRVKCVLANNNIIVSEKVIRNLMKEENLVVFSKRCRKYNSYKGEITPAVENIIDRNFHAESPNKKWLTDITEFHIPAGKIYLSPVIDCFDGLPVSWTIGTSPDACLVNTMLENAIATLKPNEHPIVHSDRGCHYRWPGWIDRMNEAGLIRSMSKKGCSPDNSACEGFFGRLKNEMFYNRQWNNVSIDEFISILDEYIHWYAEKRVKMSLGGMSPLMYRKQQGLLA